MPRIQILVVLELELGTATVDDVFEEFQDDVESSRLAHAVTRATLDDVENFPLDDVGYAQYVPPLAVERDDRDD